MIFLVESAGILLGTLPLVVGYFQLHWYAVGIGILSAGLLWLASHKRRWDWLFAAVGLFVLVCAAGLGIWLGMPAVWMALSVLGCLSAWDLAHFSHRLQRAAPEDVLLLLERAHLLRLALLDGVSLALILTARLIHLQISFGWMLLLALAAILGVVQLVRQYRRGDRL